jgi:hypothetical protein
LVGQIVVIEKYVEDTCIEDVHGFTLTG